MTTFVALGDSITVGMGDPAPGGGWRGWAALLAGTLAEPEVHNLARLGALAADVERVQLPAAMTLRPDVASVVVGINDTLRGDFDPERTGSSVARTVAALRAAGAQVLTMRLPDPGQMFGLPGALSRPLARRMRAVNVAVDKVARQHGTVHLDAVRDPATYKQVLERGPAAPERARPPPHRLPLPHPSWPRPATRSAPAPTRSRPARRRPGWPKPAGWPLRAPPGCSAAPGIWSRPCWGWRYASGWASGPRAGTGRRRARRAGRGPVNLNVLSRPSGNLELNRWLPSAPLKVRNRLSERNERDDAAMRHGVEGKPMSQTYDPNESEQHPSGQGYPAGPGSAATRRNRLSGWTGLWRWIRLRHRAAAATAPEPQARPGHHRRRRARGGRCRGRTDRRLEPDLGGHGHGHLQDHAIHQPDRVPGGPRTGRCRVYARR